MKTIRPGFHPRRDAKLTMIEYSKYYLVPGYWIYVDRNRKPVRCWATFTPDRKYLGCSYEYLNAKERVKSHKIEKLIAK